MAIEKKLICFARLEEFERQLAAGNILDYSIVFIQDAKKIWTRGTYYHCNSDIKQDTLVSGTNIKTINGESILGEGDLIVEGGGGFLLPLSLFEETPTISQEDYDKLCNTINNGGVINIPLEITENSGYVGSQVSCSYMQGITNLLLRIENAAEIIEASYIIDNNLTVMVVNSVTLPKASKLSQLENDSNFVSSDGLKTINGESIVGSGNIEISGGASEDYVNTAIANAITTTLNIAV